MYKPVNIGAPRPMNTLMNNNISSRTSIGFRPSSRESPSSPPPSKRQKRGESTSKPTHTRAVFAVVDEPSEQPTPRKRSIGSVSVTDSQRSVGSNKRGRHGAFPEYLETERLLHPRRKRVRTKSKVLALPGQGGGIEDPEANFLPPLKSDEEISDDEDEVHLLNPQKASAGPRLLKREQHAYPLSHISKYFSQDKTRTHLDSVGRFRGVLDKVDGKTKRHESDGSSDELALNPEEMPTRHAKRRKEFHASLSKKGEIQPTKFKNASTAGLSSFLDFDEQMRKAELIIGAGLRIVRGASGQCLYQADYESGGDPDFCLLSVREISHTLFPVGQDGNILEPYAYLTVNLAKARTIIRARGDDPSHIIAINCDSTDLSNSAGPKLMVEFASSQEWSKFLEWIAIYRGSRRQITVKESSRTRLENDFDEMARRAKSHKVIRDGDTRAVVGDDIKVIQHNHDSRDREIQKGPSFESNESGSRLKLKDAMGLSSVSRPNGDGNASSQTGDHRQSSALRQARTTRSTFTHIESPEPHEPEPEGWTSLNPGWGRKWRNSLVFPDKGKNRATIDKDDIQRLDEGQFLNDNIIIFYLRFLQQKLEDERPDLAQRIYFHNTFFYDKLKPTKSGQGINYDSVKAWTSKVDIFSKDFIIVPINEYTHWYVAIICNAPKLVPSSNSHEQAGDNKSAVIAISDDTDAAPSKSKSSLQDGAINGDVDNEQLTFSAQEAVVENFRRMSIESSPSRETKQKTENEADAKVDLTYVKDGREVHVITDSDRPKTETGHITTATSPQTRKKAGKRQIVGARKCDPSRPRIITLDSLGATHSPTCGYLKQYLVAELEDKKGIKIPDPGAMGTTARDIPEQTNHCDCGLFLLGYIQEFLCAPDDFVKSLLQRDRMIPWSLDPSELRNNIRTLVFDLQEKQQKREDAAREQKRQAKMRQSQTKLDTPSHAHPSVGKPSYCHSKSDRASQDCHGEEASGSKVSSAAPSSRPSSSKGNNTALEGVMNHDNYTVSDSNAEGAIATKQPSSPRIHHGRLKSTEQTKTSDRVVMEGVPAKSKTALDVLVSPCKTEQSSGQEPQGRIPGAFPISPVEGRTAKHRSLSPSPVSQTPSSKSSRGATPHDPVVVDDSDNNRRDRVWQEPRRRREDGPARRPITDQPPNHTYSQSSGQDDKADDWKQSGQQSSYFANRQDGERVTAARLREKPQSNVIDLSED